jgi:hypothetical protein
VLLQLVRNEIIVSGKLRPDHVLQKGKLFRDLHGFSALRGMFVRSLTVLRADCAVLCGTFFALE